MNACIPRGPIWTKSLREQQIPLFALESQDPVKEFDFLGITIQYEMCYTNILQILDLSRIPLLASERGEEDPIVIGGGPCAYNPEPLADFFDMFYIGEGETQYYQLFDLYKACKKEGLTRKEFLRKAACTIPGIYVPGFYEVSYKEDGTIESFHPVEDCFPATIDKQIEMDVTDTYYPKAPVVPFIKVTQDRGRSGDPARMYPGLQILSGGYALPPVQGAFRGDAESLCQGNDRKYRS